ncbi:MAG: TFIIB-type zinc ribbon-containing protein, partial [Lachnospiraceae bacterium]|nr:TFIIB-type zinc ribbon-containing protein [Lachnospiraceae bacterium]
MDETKIIDTGEGAADGQTKCPKCGATDISLNAGNGKLRCNFCRFEFEPQALETMKPGVGDLSGEQIGSGAADIDASAETTVTLKCTSCGAEVVIDLNEASQARCHWCRNMLSINSKVPNGIVPDAVLPFKMKREEAEQKINDYVGSRKFFANKVFQQEFTTNNIMGVYFPYMLVDMKGHASFDGEGEIETGSYQRGSDKDKETIFKVDRYHVHRECDVVIDDLAVESSARRAGKAKGETNNIINAILPFDTENCVKYDANYLKGFTSEKRDVNKRDLQGIVDSQEHEAIKFSLNDSVSKYDRGVHWDTMDVKKEGEKWISAYLPVWLYSYIE